MDLRVYRGTQRIESSGLRKIESWTPSFPVAVIWSAHPGDEWGSRPPHFLPTSTVHSARIVSSSVLSFGHHNSITMCDVLQYLKFDEPGGITHDEVMKVYTYLHRRLVGLAKGGRFNYRLLDEDDGEPRDENDEVPFTLRMEFLESLASIARDEWEDDPTLARAGLFEADTFIFADSPIVQNVARRLGYDVLDYADVFQGGESAAEELLGCDVYSLDGVEEDSDVEDEFVPTHRTLRPLNPACLRERSSALTMSVLDGVKQKCSAVMDENPFYNPSDERRRKLERRAMTGDPEAESLILREDRRSGEASYGPIRRRKTAKPIKEYGKFEGLPEWAAYFYELSSDDVFYSDDVAVLVFIIDAEDRGTWTDFDDVYAVWLWEMDDGRVEVRMFSTQEEEEEARAKADGSMTGVEMS